MESISVAYQHVCEVHISHKYLSGPNKPVVPVPDWLLFYVDDKTSKLLKDKKLVIRPFDDGFRIATIIKADKVPLVDLSDTKIRIGFTFIPSVAAHTKLDAHFRYVFGNTVAKLNGSVYPDISKQTTEVVDPTESERLFGYMDINIIRGPGSYDLLDNTGKLKYQKATPDSKFFLTFEQ
jgi:hypothetical protein